jgi:hypothetical protein
MKQKLNKGLKRDSIMLESTCKILKDFRIDKFQFKVSVTKKKYIKMLKQKYISCLINLNSNQIDKGIKEINYSYQKKINFNDILESIQFKRI